MKIIKVITGLGMGGAEKQLCILADELTTRENDVTIISLTGRAVCKPVNKNISIIEFDMQKNLWSFTLAVIKLAYILYKLKPDIIHAHMFHANIVARFSSLFSLNIKRLVCTAHSKNEGGSLRMFCYRLTDFMCAKTTNVSHEALENFIQLKAFKPGKSKVVYNGVDFDLFSFSEKNRKDIRYEFSIKDNETLILSVGRLTEAKDFPNLLQAIKILDTKTIRLLIVGDGELKSDLLTIVHELGLDERVTFAGLRNDVNRFYSAADLFVLSSRWEGFGLVVAEAMGTLCPVVATDAGGLVEVVGSKEFIVPINDSISLANKIKTTINSSGVDREKTTLVNYQHVIKNFSIANVLACWDDIYAGLAKK